MEYQAIIEILSRVIEGAGIVTIVIGTAGATVKFFSEWLKAETSENMYRTYKQNVGRSILLGLEFLVAGDIIHSVVISPSFTSVGILAIIVIIRSFLSMELEMEIEGKWPWQQHKKHSI